MTATPAKYEIFVRNSSLQYVGEVDQFDKLTYTKRFNQVGSFVLQMDSAHPMAPYLATPGYGITVLRNGVQDFTGPVRYFERQGGSTRKLIVKGYDDLIWVADKQAYPVAGYPYAAAAQAAHNLLRLYSFGESVGASIATDSSGNSQNANYHSAYTLGQPSIIDDITTSVKIGTGGYVAVPTTGLPSGNASFYMAVWFIMTAYPAATAVLGQLGTIATNNQSYMGILSSGVPTVQVLGVNYNGSTPLTLNEPHMMAMRWDSVNNAFTLLVDDFTNPLVNISPGTLTNAYGTATFGGLPSGANTFTTGSMQYGMIGGSLLPASPNVLYFDSLPTVGFNRFANNTSVNNPWDTQSGAAETVVKHFVTANLGSGASSDRQLANFNVQTDAAQGTTVYADALFQQLLQPDGNGLLQILARNGGIGFTVAIVAGALQFQVYVPNDKTSAAIFSDGLGNLGDYSYSVDGQQVTNYVLAAGGNATPANVYIHALDSTSQGNYGRIEGFVAGGSSTDYLKLQQLALNAIASAAQQTTFSATLLETDGLRYGRDFGLGDKVTVYVDGVTIQDLIREVQIDLDPTNGETVTPAIGTPGSGQIIAALRGFEKHLNKLNTRLTVLERAP